MIFLIMIRLCHRKLNQVGLQIEIRGRGEVMPFTYYSFTTVTCSPSCDSNLSWLDRLTRVKALQCAGESLFTCYGSIVVRAKMQINLR